MNNKSFFLILLSLLFINCGKNDSSELSILSPDKNIELKLSLIDSKPYYSIRFKSELIIENSQLGLQFSNNENLDSNLILEKIEESSVNNSWQQVWGEKKLIKNQYNQVLVYIKTNYKPVKRFKLVFRIFDDGVGIRYEIPKQEHIDSILISNELTEFNFSRDYNAWWIPANFDSYEMQYSNDTLSEIESANTPFTLKSDNGTCISIHEAALTNYAGMTLKKSQKNDFGFEVELVPWPDGIKVRTKDTLKTPWRTIQIAESDAGLIESSLILNLNEPCKIKNTSWIQPMKYIGIWWGMHLGTQTWTLGERHGATTQNMKKYIDFAAQNNIQAVLAEGWNTGWENWGATKAFDQITPYQDFDIEELSRHSKSKGVQLMGHHETGGDAEYYEQKLDEALAMLQKHGIKALKTGYAGPIRPAGQYHHGQFMVNHYRKVVETAARYNIMVNAHEPIKPTGIRRTFPNMMTREGVRGMEWNAWSDGNSPEHHTILPFTRNLAGPTDYTPGIFDILYKNAKNRVKWNDLDKGTSRVNTTLAKQLALYVVFYSPFQMASDLIENYKEHEAFQFIRDVPVNWEKTVVVNANIGDFVTIARKDILSNDWYLGSITDEKERSFEISLNFLDENVNYIAEIYSDTSTSDWKSNPTDYLIDKKEVDSKTKLTIKLAAGGGQAIRFKSMLE